MPSTLLMSQSGGSTLVSGTIFSGQLLPVGSVKLRLSSSGFGPVYVCLPPLSGQLGTINSGGNLSSGGIADGWELVPGGEYTVPKIRLQMSGLGSITIQTPTTSSGSRLFWELN